MSFSKQLKKAMAKSGVTQSELSSRTGICKSAISQYISGKNEPKELTIHRIAKALGCSVDFLNSESEGEIDAEDLKNVPIEQAAKMLGKSKQFVRIALQKGIAPFGFAVKLSGNKFSYHISPKKLAEYVGD
jgi:transcriptional regulator with XRE-family HTH domain